MNWKKVTKLDILSIRPYITMKIIVLIIAASVLQAVISPYAFSIIAMLLIFGVVFSAQPFMLGADLGSGSLFKIFHIDSKDVVKGRYLFGTLVTIIAYATGVILAIVIGSIWSFKDLSYGLLVLSPCGLFASLFLVFFIYPIYFKYGYKKAWPFQILLIIVGPIIFLFLFLSVYDGYLIMDLSIIQKFKMVAMMFGISSLSFLISYSLSKKIYAKKDC